MTSVGTLIRYALASLAVIASEAKQSSSLARGTALDCFVASLLAMTRN